MKQFHGIQALLKQEGGRLTDKRLAELLMQDLATCELLIEGCVNDKAVLLARLQLQEDSLSYEPFDKRIDFVMCGEIIRDDCSPVTYRLQGRQTSITGRCSMIAKVCGVDLYLSRSYTGKQGDKVQQKLKIKLSEIKT